VPIEEVARCQYRPVQNFR